MTKYVVSGTYQEYVNHIKKNGYNPAEYKYVSEPFQLRGISEIDGFYIGTYEQRSDIDAIRAFIAITHIKSQNKTTLNDTK